MIEIDYFAHVPMFCQTSAFPDHCFVRTKLGVIQFVSVWNSEWREVLRRYNYFLS